MPIGSRLFARSVESEVTYFADLNLQNQLRVKIGLVDTDHCFDRLRDWDNSFYIPGRLHKPVEIVDYRNSDILDVFEENRKINLKNGIIAAYISLPPDRDCTIWDLYHSLIRLSYLGDIRVGIAENPKKIENILNSQFPQFDDIYSKYLNNLKLIENYKINSKIDKSELWNQLPAKFRSAADPVVNGDYRSALISTLTRINRRESLHQALVGVGNTGITRSAIYLFKKLQKRFR